MTRRGKSNNVGFGNPPHHTRFKPGKSGNPKGRPKGSKNFAMVIARELNDRVHVKENGKQRKISKRQVIAKQVVNKAAGGDLKAAQALFTQERIHEEVGSMAEPLSIFDTPEHHQVIAQIVRRIRAMDPPATEQEQPVQNVDNNGEKS